MMTPKSDRAGRVSVADLVISALVVLIAFTFAPALARLQRSSGEAQCQSNLRRWSQAMALYLTDNQSRYPTNRPLSGGAAGGVSSICSLTPDGQPNPDGTPKRFALSINWVEALYPYLWKAADRTGEDWKTFRACPRATARTPITGVASGGSTANSYMTYVMNMNLVEQSSVLQRAPGKLMMLRELDCRVNSLLRPSNTSPDGTWVPKNAFLNSSDSTLGAPPPFGAPTTGQIHASGSYVAFADGHVRYCTVDYYPTTPEYDTSDQCWYNFVTSGTPATQKTIAITP